MDSILLKIDATRLRNAEFLQYHTQNREAIAQNHEAEEALAAALVAYDQRLEELNIVFMRDRASALTAQIEAADRQRDDLLTGLTLLCKSATYSPQPALKSAANLLLHHIGIYGNSIQLQSINAETASLNSLLGDFADMPNLAAAITAIGATPWIAPLAAANTQVATLYQQRTTETADTTLPYTMKEKRAEMTAEWTRLGDKIAGYYAINDGTEPWGPLVGVLNALTRRYDDLLRARAGRAANDDNPENP